MSLDVKIRRMRTRGATGNLKAFFTVSVGPVEIEDMRLLDGRNGLFVGFPSKKVQRADGSTSWFDIVRLSRDSTGEFTPEASEMRNTILNLAVAEYDRRMREEGSSVGANVVDDDDLPF